MKKRMLSTLLALAMALALLPGTALSAEELPFTDVPENAWYYDAVKYVYENGIMSGSGGEFSPNTELTRAQLCQLLYNMEGQPGTEGCEFSDVAPGAWYYNAVSWAAAHDIAGSVGDGLFAPNEPATRERMADILYRYSVYKGYDTSSAADISGYADADQVSGWAVTAMQWAVGEKLIQGVTETAIAPGGTTTRNVFAAVIMRFCQKHEEQDAEITAAIEAGLFPEEWLGDLDAVVTYAELCSMLDTFASNVYPARAGAWAGVCAKYHDAEDAMSRMEGALVLFYFAECTGLDSIGYEYNIPLGDLVAPDVDTDAGITWDYPLLPDTTLPYFNQVLADSENYSWRCGLDYRDNTHRFIQCFSYGNGKTYLDYDEDFSPYLGKAFLRKDAIRAVERLYETARFTLYTPVENSKSTVSEETLRLAAQMPQATDQKLPYWTGYSLQGRSWSAGYGIGMRYEKEEIDVLAAQGFNFVRAPLNFNDIFQGTDTSRINEAFLENMDRLIGYCAENGVHVCFDLHDMPGFTTDGDDSDDILFTDKALQQLFVDFWTVLAKRYQDIPSNLLSFNLLNEPHGREELTDAVYSEVMKKAVHAIRDVSEDRLIFADMLGVVSGIPVYGLVDEHVVQTIHPYYLANGAQEWPVYMINGFIERRNGELLLKGTFKQGDRLSLEFGGVHAASTFTAYADGVPAAEYQLGTEQPGENHCIGIGEEGTGGEFRSYEGAIWEITLPEDCSEIRIGQENGWWYQVENLLLETGGSSIHVTVNNWFVSGDGVPVLLVGADGTLTAENEGTLGVQSREWVEEFIRKYLDFTAETGVLVMVQEFGYDPSNSYQATLDSADDFLAVLQEHGIPWCSWSSSLGPVIDKREAAWYQLVFSNDDLLRKDAVYAAISENWLLDQGLMEVFRKHMG